MENPIKNKPPLVGSLKPLNKFVKTIPKPKPSMIPPGIRSSYSFETIDQIINSKPSEGRKRIPKIESLKKIC
jgi:hypothetical protein